MDPTARNSAEDSTRTSECARAEQITRALQARLRTRGNGTLKYRIGDEIGRGGMGRVFHAHDEDLRRDIAMKVIRVTNGERDARANGGPSSMELARFLEEAQVTGQLDHPGIVPVHELGLDADGQVYFTMKLVRGEDLSRVLEHALTGAEGWNATRVVGALLKVCEAMAYAHSKNVIHRDLKPSNIRIGRFGAVYVMDWGLARVLGQPDDRDLRVRELDPAAASRAVSSERHSDGPGAASLHTMDGTPIGTPMFMSPEQAMGRLDRMGPQTDVYGIGAILYTLLTGQTPYVSPFTQVGPLQIVEWIKEGPPTPIVELAPRATPELVAICDKAMSRDPSLRYADMSELADELRAYLESRVVRAYRTGPWPEFVLWVRRNRVVAALVACFVCVLTLAGFGLAWQRGIAAEESRRNADAFEVESLLDELVELGPLSPDSLPTLDRWFDRAGQLLLRQPKYQRDANDLLDRALQSGSAQLEEQPPSEASVFRVRGLRADREKYAAELANPSTSSDDTIDESWKRAYERDLHTILTREIARIDSALKSSAILEQTRTRPRFDDALVQQQFDALTSLLLDLESLQRDAWREAERLYDVASWSHGPSDEEWSSAWARVAADLDTPETRAPYGESRLHSRKDLLPLARNAISGLWEFWHIPSGTRPEPNGSFGWKIGADTGMVMVLIPAGKALVGASNDPFSCRWDELAGPDEFMSSAELDPFLLSKYEMTQGQWLRLTGRVPSEFAAGGQWFFDPRVSLSHPVESVSHDAAVALLSRLGMHLPTEMQFEYAARAGGETPWANADARALHHFANHYDAAILRSQTRGPADDSDAAAAGETIQVPVEFPNMLDDGRAIHAAVGSYAPNAFGLHEMLGNVAEWCEDWYVAEGVDVRVDHGTGERVPTRATERVVRGGDYLSPRELVRHSARSHARADSESKTTGLRPAIRITSVELLR